jgi:hypothetical protein
VTGPWFTAGTPVSSTNKTEILLKVALNTINQHCDGIYYLIFKDWLLLNVRTRTSSTIYKNDGSMGPTKFDCPIKSMEFGRDNKFSHLSLTCMQWAWHSPNMLPTMVNGQNFHIIMRQSPIKKTLPICHLPTRCRLSSCVLQFYPHFCSPVPSRFSMQKGSESAWKNMYRIIKTWFIYDTC